MTQQIDVYEPKWKVVTSNGEKTITEDQMDKILKAEQLGARLVKFGDWVINIAFIQEAFRIAAPKPKAVWDDELGKPVPAE